MLPSPILSPFARATKWKSITRSTIWRALQTIFAIPFASGLRTTWRALTACRSVICFRGCPARLIKRQRHRQRPQAPSRRAHNLLISRLRLGEADVPACGTSLSFTVGDLRIEIVAVLQRRARATLASREHAPVHRIAPKPTRHATPARVRSPGSRSIASITNCLAPAAPLRSEHRLGALCTLPAGASAPGSSFRRSN